MKLLFDQGTPAPLRRRLTQHSVDTLAEKGWSDKSNGELLDVAEACGHEVLVTTDQSLRYQQNLAQRQIGIVVLLDTNWALVRERVQQVAAAIEGVGEAKLGRSPYEFSSPAGTRVADAQGTEQRLPATHRARRAGRGLVAPSGPWLLRLRREERDGPSLRNASHGAIRPVRWC